MATAIELYRQGRKGEIWDTYCGFLDLSCEQFMAIQRKRLEEQLPRYAASRLGQRILGHRAPRTLEEFRSVVPFTTYKDYAPFLLSRDENALPEKPRAWGRTSGRSGEYESKWIPYTQRNYELIGEAALGSFILSAARRKGDVVLAEGMKFPYTIAPAPYVTGIGAVRLLELFPFRSFPPIERIAEMDFPERMRVALESSLREGMDYFFGVTSILLKISESFSQLGRGGSSEGIRLSPRGMLRIARALVKSTLRGRPVQPKDIWKVKGVLCGGMDTSIFKDKVAESWGRPPLEAYVATEFGGIATQSLSYDGLTFFPDTNFWEFITEQDYRRVMVDPIHIPSSYLMSDVQPDREYVLVGTNFYGGALMRYILGDLVKFTALEDARAGVRLPQMTFVSRIDGLIDVGGFTRLTEKTIWNAIEVSGIPYEEWSIRKESAGGKPVLRLYLETRDRHASEAAIAERIHCALKSMDQPYRDLEEITGLKPLVVTLLSKGTFHRYFEERQAAGADLAHLKPPHVNASDAVVRNLLRMSSWEI